MTAPEIPAERVPTTDLIRDQYAAAVDEYGTFDGWHLTDAEARVAFDAWLAQHDAEVRAHVLNEAADEMKADWAKRGQPIAWLRNLADAQETQ